MPTTPAVCPNSAHPLTPDCPAVQIPTRDLVPGMNILEDDKWRHIYSANSYRDNALYRIEGPEPYPQRVRSCPADAPHIVHVPDTTDIPPETEALAALNRHLAEPRSWNSVSLRDHEVETAARYLARGNNEWRDRYRAMPWYDLACNYVARRRWDAALRETATLAEQQPYSLQR